MKAETLRVSSRTVTSLTLLFGKLIPVWEWSENIPFRARHYDVHRCVHSKASLPSQIFTQNHLTVCHQLRENLLFFKPFPFAVEYGMLGSVDSNTGEPSLGIFWIPPPPSPFFSPPIRIIFTILPVNGWRGKTGIGSSSKYVPSEWNNFFLF